MMRELTSLLTDIGRRARYEYDRRIGGFPEEVDAWGHHEDTEGGMSNDVWITETGDVAKAMNPLPGTALITGASNHILGSGGYRSSSDRLVGEELVATEIGDGTSLETADIYDTVRYVLRMEYKEHDVFKDWAEDADAEEVGRAAYRFGSDLRRIHNAGYALTDVRLENLGIDASRDAAPSKPAMFPQDPAQIWFDGEYAKTGAGEGDRLMDLTTLVSSARHMDPDAYDAFLDQFEKGYGDDVPEQAHALANITSKAHARYLEQEPVWEEHAYRNAHDVEASPWHHVDDAIDALIETDAAYGVWERAAGYDGPRTRP